MTKEELDILAAEKLSGFGGDSYDGFDDDTVDFDGPKKSFASKVGAKRIFVVKIVSAATGTKNVIINNAYSSTETPSGAIVLAEGAVSLITTTGSPKSFDNFAGFCARNPVLVKGFKFKAKNSDTQLDIQMMVVPVTPFKTPESRIINIGAYQDENTYQTKTVTVPEEIIFSHQTLVYFGIEESETVTITLFCSAILNTALMLEKKNERARRNKEKK
jgi:hypothetical protein